MSNRITGKETKFNTMSRIELAAWYVHNVGYDPIEDEPRIKLSDLRRTCREYCEIRDYAEANPDW
jgi:hypothetical protein